MTTVETPAMAQFAKDWARLYSSAKFLGIVGDARHLARGGYHISREDNASDNYSMVRPDDRYGPVNAASAIDMGLSRTDMINCTRRLVAAYNNPTDPRRKYVNAFNGWLGSGDATRYDFYARKTKTATDDHKTHIHLEFRRRFCNSAVAMGAVLSILRGDTVAQYLGVIGAKPAALVKAKPPPYPGHAFKRDDRMKPDANLARWQRQMIARGWRSIGAADGVFGAKTETVVRLFQAACQVAVDGEIGPVTWPLPWTRPTSA